MFIFDRFGDALFYVCIFFIICIIAACCHYIKEFYFWYKDVIKYYRLGKQCSSTLDKLQTANKELSAVIKDLESENTKLLKRTLDDAKEIKWMRQTTLKCMENEDMSHAYFHAKEEEISRLSALKERQSKEIINLLTKCNTYKQDYEDIKKKYDKLLEEMLKKERSETICPTLLNNHLGEEATTEIIRLTSK